MVSPGNVFYANDQLHILFYNCTNYAANWTDCTQLPTENALQDANTGFLQGVSIVLLCKPCTSYDRQAIRLSVCLSARPSVRHTLALSENDASEDHEILTIG